MILDQQNAARVSKIGRATCEHDDMDQDTADDLVQKTGMLAMLYYPEIHADDSEYSLSDDVAFALEGVTGIGDDDRAALEDLVSRTIIDPTAHREALCAYVYGLVPDSDS
jgi:hypothetical protein